MKHNKMWLVLAALVLVMTISVGGTIAYLIDKTEAVENTFTPSSVEITTTDSFDGTTKSNIVVENTGKVDVYVRVLLVANWCDKDGHPVTGWTGTFPEALGTNWVKSGDYYYYTKKLTSNDPKTTSLFGEAEITAGDIPANYPTIDHLEIDVLAQAVQADPDKTPATEAWGSTAAGLLE